MLVKCLDYLRNKGAEWQSVQVFGQEVNGLTSSIARMNLYLNGIEDFSIACADTLENPAFLDGSHLRKFDIVLANPPYSIKEWNREKFMNDKWGRNFLGTPPQGRADYAFIQHILASMDEKTGRCAILLPHGVLNRMEEEIMRRKLIEEDLVDSVISIGKNLFFNSPMGIMLCSSKKPSDRIKQVLFIRATDLVERKNGESYLTEEHVEEIVSLYRGNTNVDNRSCIVDTKTISQNEYSISPKLYVKQTQTENILKFSEQIEQWQEYSCNIHSEYTKLINLL